MRTFKLLFVLVAVLVTGIMHAQSIQIKVRDTGADVTGDTLWIGGPPTVGMKHPAYLRLHNVGQDSIKIKAERKEHCHVSGMNNSMCFGFTCNDFTSGATPVATFPLDFVILAPGDSSNPNACYLELNPQGLSGCECYHVRFWDEWGPADSSSCDIIACAWAVGLNELNHYGSKAVCYPNPAVNLVNVQYELKRKHTSARLHIKDVTGRAVKQITISDLTGTKSFDVSELRSGVHFYSLVLDGVEKPQGKLLITH